MTPLRNAHQYRFHSLEPGGKLSITKGNFSLEYEISGCKNNLVMRLTDRFEGVEVCSFVDHTTVKPPDSHITCVRALPIVCTKHISEVGTRTRGFSESALKPFFWC